ncbi:MULTISPECIES: hypothetical protein [unclassified Caballeronia]|uniref:hypothetical protein n=1 Tax=unclassified Caballeronia TaxID=2646786 RepID=UPI002027ED0D|nr:MULTISPECIES: hypothetical protein [unclassified Caballeronia]
MRDRTFTDAEAKDIPRLQGVYAFFLDLISPAKIGLAGKGPWDQSTLQKAKVALVRRAQRHMSIAHSIELQGMLAEADKTGPLQAAYSISARKKTSFTSAHELEQLALTSVREYAEIMHETATFSQPLYVGITYEQTLYERYVQHRAAFRSDLGTLGFGGRVRDLELDWDDLLFCCKPLSHPTTDRSALRKAERHLHALTHPICSLK